MRPSRRPIDRDDAGCQSLCPPPLIAVPQYVLLLLRAINTEHFGCHWQLAASAFVQQDTGGQAASGTLRHLWCSTFSALSSNFSAPVCRLAENTEFPPANRCSAVRFNPRTCYAAATMGATFSSCCTYRLPASHNCSRLRPLEHRLPTTPKEEPQASARAATESRKMGNPAHLLMPFGRGSAFTSAWV